MDGFSTSEATAIIVASLVLLSVSVATLAGVVALKHLDEWRRWRR